MATPETLICAALRNEAPAWPWTGEQAQADFLDRVRLHGVGALLHAQQPAATAQWPAAVREALRQGAFAQAVWETQHQRMLAEVLGALAAQDIQPVLIKGTPLAYSVYADPVLRSRGDTDFVIPPAAKERTREVLLSLGFESPMAVSGEFVSYQASFTRVAGGGNAHTLDVHWKINNSEVLSRLLAYDELRAHAQALPALCPAALAAGPVDALLIACFHRATHRQNPYWVGGTPHYGDDRLVWLCDIDLLARRFSRGEWEAFARTAAGKGLGAVCLQALQEARDLLHAPLPGDVVAVLSGAGAGAADRYLAAGKLRQQWMDFVALGTGARQLRFLRELLFPPADYMRAKYPQAIGGLPWLYLRRAFGGLAKGVARGRTTP